MRPLPICARLAIPAILCLILAGCGADAPTDAPPGGSATDQHVGHDPGSQDHSHHPSPSPSGAAPELTDETQRMIDRLARLSADDALIDNRFENILRAKHLETKPRPQGFQARFDADINLAREWLRAGDTQRSIDRLEAVASTLEGTDVHPSVVHQVRHLLAVAYLRLGEQQNCLEHHHAASCLVPIQEAGRHVNPTGSQKALEAYAEILRDDPDDLSAVWLYNLAAMTLGQYPDDVPEAWRVDPAVFDSGAHLEPFHDMAMAVGAATADRAGGVVMDDLDGDGRLDLLVSSWGITDPLRYLHNTGRGFEDRSVAAGIAELGGGLNLIHADYDNDGDMDVLVLRGAWLNDHGRHPNSLLRNRGNGTFDDVTESAGVLTFHPTQAAAWADFDRDGWLDLFVGNESSRGTRHPAELYRNNGDGTFTDIARASGLDVVAFVKGVAWGDIDNDGWPDLFLSTMHGSNMLFRNGGKTAEGDGSGWHFEDVTARAGVSEPKDAFPTWFWDFDNDGFEDLFVASYGTSFLGPVARQVAADYLGLDEGVSEPRLYRNRGDGTFEDVTEHHGLDRAVVAMGGNFGDLDNDGYPDLYLGTGAPNFMALAPNRMFRNRGGGGFDEVTTAGGFGHIQKGHGIAFGDWDEDGDQDVYAVMGGAFSGDVYPNAFFENPGGEHRWITLRLEGTASNRFAVGARVRVHIRTADGPRTVHTTVSTGGSFGSSSLQQEIGLGRAEAVEWLEVTWPASGTVQRFDAVELDRTYRVREGEPALLDAT